MLQRTSWKLRLSSFHLNGFVHKLKKLTWLKLDSVTLMRSCLQNESFDMDLNMNPDFFQLCVDHKCTDIRTFTSGLKRCPNNCTNGNGVRNFTNQQKSPCLLYCNTYRTCTCGGCQHVSLLGNWARILNISGSSVLVRLYLGLETNPLLDYTL